MMIHSATTNTSRPLKVGDTLTIKLIDPPYPIAGHEYDYNVVSIGAHGQSALFNFQILDYKESTNTIDTAEIINLG